MEPVEVIESLGICPNCQRVVSVTEYAADESMEGRWMCVCGTEVDYAAFGWDKPTNGARKVRWVGPDGKWTETRPITDFKIGNTDVLLERNRFAY